MTLQTPTPAALWYCVTVHILTVHEQTLYSPCTVLSTCSAQVTILSLHLTGNQYSQAAVQITVQNEGSVTATEPEKHNSSITSNQHKVTQCDTRNLESFA